MNTKQLGDIGVAMAIAYYTKKGYGVSVPLSDNLRYDLIVDDGTSLKKVQVKSTTFMSSSVSYSVNLKTCGGNQSWTRIKKFIDENETDLVFVYCGDGSQYEFPAKVVASRGTLVLSSSYQKYKV